MSAKNKITNFKFSILIIILMFFIIFISGNQIIKASPVKNESPFENSNFVEIDGIVLHYRIDRSEEKQSKGKILMVHGMGGSTYCWRKNVEPLNQKGFDVVRVDLPGFGFSDRQPGLDHTAKNRADWLWGLLDYLDSEQFNETKNWVLVGHSMGGKTIAEMALSRDERVEVLIFVAGAVYNSPPNLIGNLANKTPFNHIFEFVISKIIHQRFTINRGLNSAYGREVTEEELLNYLEPLKIDGTARAWLDLVRSSSDELNNLEQLETDSLLVWGSEDDWVPVEEAIKLDNQLPNSWLEIISDNHHMPMVTASEQFNELIIDFLINFIKVDDNG